MADWRRSDARVRCIPNCVGEVVDAGMAAECRALSVAGSSTQVDVVVAHCEQRLPECVEFASRLQWPPISFRVDPGTFARHQEQFVKPFQILGPNLLDLDIGKLLPTR